MRRAVGSARPGRAELSRLHGDAARVGCGGRMRPGRAPACVGPPRSARPGRSGSRALRRRRRTVRLAQHL